MTLLQVKDLRVQLGNFQAVKGITFDIMPGEIVALVGESGSGKSATALSLLKLLPAQTSKVAGEVLFNSQNILTMDTAQLRMVRGRQIGIIFQEPLTALNPTMKIGYQLIEGLAAHHALNAQELIHKGKELLTAVGIPDSHRRFEEYPYQFSGGMRQRILIAIAIANRPSLLIADEPTTALDPTIQRQILELIKSLQKEIGTALLLITHDLGVVAGYADRVLVMKSGHIVEAASVEKIFTDPQHPYTRMLIESARASS